MADDAGLPADHAPRTDPRAASDAYTAGNRSVVADTDVVPNLDLVVDLYTVTDHRIVQRTPINCGICADFDMIAMNNAILTKHTAGIDRGTRRNPGVRADVRTTADVSASTDVHAFTKHGTLFNNRARIDRHRGRH